VKGIIRNLAEQIYLVLHGEALIRFGLLQHRSFDAHSAGT
jgi:hypothetical protein